jgi:hypothetical protein
MSTIENPYDLASLPEPRFISSATARARLCAIALLLFGAAVGGAAFVAGLAGDNLFMAGLAATPDGLFVVTPVRKVVFAPWRDVLDIAVVQKWTGKRIVSYPQLTLRLSEASWSKFGGTGALKGRGPVRDYTMGTLTVSAETLVDELVGFRHAHG